MKYTEKRLEFREKLREIMIWIKVQPHEDYTDAIVGLFDTSIAQAIAEERERVVGEILELPRFIEEDDRGVKFPMVEIESIKNYAEQKGINLSLQDKTLTDKECDCRLDYRDKNCTTHTPHFIIDDGLSSLDTNNLKK